MLKVNGRSLSLLGLICFLPLRSEVEGQTRPTFEVELEAGPVWQTRNRIQIPNDERGTRFSLADLAGKGPWPAGRLLLTWNLGETHGIRVLLAPLAIQEVGSSEGPVAFAGETFQAGQPVRATYQFNSWRASYRYRAVQRESGSFWIGFTAKLRDALVELRQGNTVGRDTDFGFVPLLHLGADWRVSGGAHLLFDFDGLAGGPGRAIDAALKLGYDLGDQWRITGGYRSVEGGADVESVYNFAWLHFASVSLVFRY